MPRPNSPIAWCADEVLKKGIPKILDMIKDVEKKLDKCDTITDWGYVLNGVMRDLNLSQKERYIIAKIFWESQKEKDRVKRLLPIARERFKKSEGDKR